MPIGSRLCRRAKVSLGSAVLLALSPAMSLAQDAGTQAANRRIAALESEVSGLSTRLASLQGAPCTSPVLPYRYIFAALNLQSALATSRPYAREWSAMRDAAPAGALAGPLADVLVSHAGRGLATTTELRESFLALGPMLVARSPSEGGWIDWLLDQGRRILASVGFGEVPTPGPVHATLDNVSRLLARGQLAPALADVEMLDDTLKPLLSGWTAQVRARVAAEQAVQETILRALGPEAN
ncbi:MAG: hypothetical protein JWR10_3480 [Rubritepida sp.]|nr:hypothetical protein [Rubritepida sp.]